MCFQAVLCNGLFERMRLQGATFYLEGDQRLSGMWCFSYANTYIGIIIFQEISLSALSKTIPQLQYLKQKNYTKKHVIRNIC